jgi:signal transduction histidine kinase
MPVYSVTETASGCEAETQRQDEEQATRVNLIGRMAARLLHELSQPLTAVLVNADVAREALRGPDAKVADIREIIEDICADAERADELLRRQRDFLTRHEMPVEPVSVSSLVEEAVLLTGSEFRGRRIELATHFPANLPAILADRVHLRQVLVNLLLNAADAMMHRPVSERHIDIRARSLEPLVEISIQDTGQRTEARHLPRAFDSAFCTQTGAAAIGLRICGDIIKAYNGEISAESNPEGGSTFRLLLAAYPEQERAANATHRESGGSAHQSSSQPGIRHQSPLPPTRADASARRLTDVCLLQVESALTSLEIAQILMESAMAPTNIALSLKAVRAAHACLRRLAGDTPSPETTIAGE